jgi:hypothetical protein
MFIAQQNLQRMNRNTSHTSHALYSSAIISISQGALLFLVLYSKRCYIFAVIINQDHCINKTSQAE